MDRRQKDYLSGDKVKIDGKIDTSDDWATNGDSDIDINK